MAITDDGARRHPRTTTATGTDRRSRAPRTRAASTRPPTSGTRRSGSLIWLFIGGDALFLVLELFTWFYLRALNINGLWNGALCTKANPCTDGLGNPITAPITKANPRHSVVIAVLAVIAAAFVWVAESHAKKGSGQAGGAPAAAWLALAVHAGRRRAGRCYQFQVLPFTTIDGAYASTYEFFMGSTLAHLILLAFIGIGPVDPGRQGTLRGRDLVPGAAHPVLRRVDRHLDGGPGRRRRRSSTDAPGTPPTGRCGRRARIRTVARPAAAVRARSGSPSPAR